MRQQSTPSPDAKDPYTGFLINGDDDDVAPAIIPYSSDNKSQPNCLTALFCCFWSCDDTEDTKAEKQSINNRGFSKAERFHSITRF